MIPYSIDIQHLKLLELSKFIIMRRIQKIEYNHIPFPHNAIRIKYGPACYKLKICMNLLWVCNTTKIAPQIWSNKALMINNMPLSISSWYPLVPFRISNGIIIAIIIWATNTLPKLCLHVSPFWALETVLGVVR